MIQKIKQFVESEAGKDILVVLVVILVGIGAFLLGRVSKQKSGTGVEIKYPDPIVSVRNDSINDTKVLGASTVAKTFTPTVKKTNAASTSSNNFFASNRGSKYYPTTCSAGKTIKQENRIYFASRSEAETAGFELSSSCR